MLSIITSSPNETRELGRSFGKKIPSGSVLLLQGDLGSGKTMFAKGVALGLGVRAKVKSPSFGVMNSYPTPKRTIKRIYHLDLYRIESGRELKELGLGEIFSEKTAVTVIEWPEKTRNFLPKKTINIRFSHGKTPKERIIEVA